MSDELQSGIPFPEHSPTLGGSVDGDEYEDTNPSNKKRRVNRDVQAYIELTEAAISSQDGEEVDLDQSNLQQAQLPVKKRRTAVAASNTTNSTSTEEFENEEKSTAKQTCVIGAMTKVSTSSNPNTFDLRWQERLHELQAYKACHGDCLVSKSNNFKLGKWVARQRQEYKKLQQGKKSCMTEERIKILEDEGFVWVVREPYKQCPWEQRFHELIQFENDRGTTVVPKNTEGYYQLSLWCMNQRQEYRKRSEGKKHKLTDDRVEKLNSIGFTWVVKGQETVSWDTRLHQLKEFKAEYGHCDVPNKSDTYAKLGEWVRRIRASYKDFLHGKSSSKLTEEKVMILENMGFDWDPASKEIPWEQRYAELCDYKDKYGDCLVPQRYPGNHQLGTWICTQRNEYKKLLEGAPSAMTEGRIKLLERIGFVWKAQKGRKISCNDHMLPVDGTPPLLKPDQLRSDDASGLPATAVTLLSMEFDGEKAHSHDMQNIAQI